MNLVWRMRRLRFKTWAYHLQSHLQVLRYYSIVSQDSQLQQELLITMYQNEVFLMAIKRYRYKKNEAL